jgi:hypothetical protein
MALPENDQNINQTSAGFIRKLPLIASFELKRQAGTDPLVQLGIWSAALAERLGKLQGSGEKESGLMTTPVVTVVGHDWKVYYSYTTEDGQRVSFRVSCLRMSSSRPTAHVMQGARLTVALLLCRCYEDRVF